MDGADGQTGGKNRSISFVLSAFISFGLFNVFQQKNLCRIPSPPFFLGHTQDEIQKQAAKKYINIQRGVKLILMVS
jgi:hypothetical protein